MDLSDESPARVAGRADAIAESLEKIDTDNAADEVYREQAVEFLYALADDLS
jgi:hypothetical protein